MKQIITLFALIAFPYILFAQAKNLDGKWQLVSFNNNTSDLSMESNEYCFWCQLTQNDFMEILNGKLKAKLNEESFIYDAEVTKNELILRKSQLVQIGLNGDKLENQVVTGFTKYKFIRGGKTLTLTNMNSEIKEVYSFKLIK